MILASSSPARCSGVSPSPSPGAHGHEDRSFDDAVGRVQPAGARAGFRQVASISNRRAGSRFQYRKRRPASSKEDGKHGEKRRLSPCLAGRPLHLPAMVIRWTPCNAAPSSDSPPLSALPAVCIRAEAQPNLVIILADDQGWGDLSINGNRNLQTPHIDSLARDGALFERFFVCSVCAPTRAEFLTGRYHPRGGVRGVSRGDERLNLDETTIADIFRAAGYATGCFGKWHSGTQHPYHPNSRGFDEYYGYTSGHWGDYFAPELDHNGEVVQGEGFLTDDLTNHAIRFIEKNRARPFLCYLPLNTPHSPMQVPDRFFEKFAALDPAQRARDESQESLPMTRAALAMCENIDWNVGRVLQSLDSAGLAKDTIVLYFSDNGPNSWRWNGGMRGRKGSLDEGGLRAPCLLRWPGKIPPESEFRKSPPRSIFCPLSRNWPESVGLRRSLWMGRASRRSCSRRMPPGRSGPFSPCRTSASAPARSATGWTRGPPLRYGGRSHAGSRRQRRAAGGGGTAAGGCLSLAGGNASFRWGRPAAFHRRFREEHHPSRTGRRTAWWR